MSQRRKKARKFLTAWAAKEAAKRQPKPKPVEPKPAAEPFLIGKAMR